MVQVTHKRDTIIKVEMFKDGAEKTDLEILQERAEVLGRAGEKLSAAIKNLTAIEKIIEAKLNSFRDEHDGDHKAMSRREEMRVKPSSSEILREINREIRRFNEAREYAKLRFYYLIVTREAMGFRRNKPVEEQYPIPPKKKPLKRSEWTDIRNKE